MIIVNIINNNIARAKLIRAVIIIINKGKTPEFLLPLINIITVSVVQTSTRNVLGQQPYFVGIPRNFPTPCARN